MPRYELELRVVDRVKLTVDAPDTWYAWKNPWGCVRELQRKQMIDYAVLSIKEIPTTEESL
jgi:hypothetical protein